MNYNEAIEYVHSLTRFGIVPGLERISALLCRLSNPQDKTRFVHVAGTNGKGSICYMSASVLVKAGYKVGLYVSPYVVRFNERIQINFKHIPDDEFARLATRVRAEVEGLGTVITEFEFITAAAFLYFAQEKCDYVVLEVGLGGRLDATNVIKKPEVSVIASVSYDHTKILGNTLSEIAAEKCGIIKSGAPTVLYPVQDESVMRTVKAVCAERQSRLTVPDAGKVKPLSERAGEIRYEYDGLEVKSHLWGNYQMYNGAAVIEAMRTLGIEDGVIAKGIEDAVIPGRLEIISHNPDILLDVGHNPAGIDATAAAVNTYLRGKPHRLFVVMGMCEDKNYTYCIQKMAGLAYAFIGVPADTPRSLEPCDAAKTAQPYCKNTMYENSVSGGIEKALSMMEKGDLLLVCGSFYVVTPAREYLTEKKYDKLSK